MLPLIIVYLQFFLSLLCCSSFRLYLVCIFLFHVNVLCGLMRSTPLFRSKNLDVRKGAFSLIFPQPISSLTAERTINTFAKCHKIPKFIWHVHTLFCWWNFLQKQTTLSRANLYCIMHCYTTFEMAQVTP